MYVLSTPWHTAQKKGEPQARSRFGARTTRAQKTQRKLLGAKDEYLKAVIHAQSQPDGPDFPDRQSTVDAALEDEPLQYIVAHRGVWELPVRPRL